MIIEINPRVQGTIVAGLGAGVNLPLLAVKQELNLPISEEELQVKWGTKFSRYWNEVFIRFQFLIIHLLIQFHEKAAPLFY